MSLQAMGVHPSDLVNDSDHGPLITVAATFSTAVALVFYQIRLGARWPWTAWFGWDDIAISLATVSPMSTC
jgi:hypothetical protein